MYLRSGNYYDMDPPGFILFLNNSAFSFFHYRKEHSAYWFNSFKLYEKSEKQWLNELVSYNYPLC